MGIAFRLGPFIVHWYGILIALAIVVGIFLARKEAKRRGENPEHIFGVMLFAAPAALIGARLYHVVHMWDKANRTKQMTESVSIPVSVPGCCI